MTSFYDISLALTAVMLLAALLWLRTLRRRVHEQSELIRQQLKRETALEAKYRDLFEQANDMVFSQDIGGKITTLNQAGEKILECSREKSLGMSLREFVAPESLTIFDQWMEQCVAGTAPRGQELTLKGGADHRHIVEINVRLLRQEGKTLALEGIARDITEKKKAEEALRQSEERFSSAFRVSPVAIAISNLTDWRFIDINQSFLRLFGFEREEVVNHTATDLGLWSDPEDRIRIDKLFLQKKSICGAECRFKVRSGTIRTTLLFAEPIFLAETACALIIVHDITDRLNLEAQLRQALKMEAIGRLAAGVAHDFNNMLTIIQGNTELVAQKSTRQQVFAEELDRIRDASHRAGSLTRQLLTFSRQQNLQRNPLDLNEVINNGIRMFRHLVHSDIILRMKYSANLPLVSADLTMIEQVLLNLVVNAHDAMPQGGELSLETAVVDITAEYTHMHPEAATGSFVRLSVTDTGCGMDAATQTRIFEPFFTTKEPGKGTGLGLATVYGVVKQHNGWIEVVSEIDHGSTFSIYLPTEKRAAIKSVAKPAPRQDEHLTILAVEDETAVAEVIRKVLTEQSHRLVEASDALSALQAWNDHQDEIDLLLTDIYMPNGMSGVELAQNLRALKANLPVLYVTARSPEMLAPETFTAPNTWLLAKPFAPSELIQAVRNCRPHA